MKTIIFMMVSLVSTMAFAKNISGVIKHAECNAPTGYGVIQIDIKKENVLESRYLKVNSKKLCDMNSSGYEHFGFKTSVMTRIALDNILAKKYTVTDLEVSDDAVVGIVKTTQIEVNEYLSGVDKVISEGKEEVYEWYLANRKIK